MRVPLTWQCLKGGASPTVALVVRRDFVARSERGKHSDRGYNRERAFDTKKKGV